jgi:hypothetical protein
MKIRNLIGLAAIGGLVYLHRKRGGEFTLESFKDSARQLWAGIERTAEKARHEAEKRVREGAKEVGKVADDVSKRAQDFGDSAKDIGDSAKDMGKNFGTSPNNGRR